MVWGVSMSNDSLDVLPGRISHIPVPAVLRVFLREPAHVFVPVAQKQTVEFRCPDGSADIYLLIAGLVVAARHGFEMEGALNYAKKTYVDVNIHKAENKKLLDNLDQLPASCWESAEELGRHREIFESHGVFPAELIDDIIKNLRAFDDKNIREEIKNHPEKMLEMVHDYFHCG